MLLLAQLCMVTSLEEWLPQETTAGQRLRNIGVSARVMSQDHSLIGCAAPPGLKLLWGCLQTQAGLRRCPRRQGIIVGAEDAPAPSDLQTNIVSPRALRPMSSTEGRKAGDWRFSSLDFAQTPACGHRRAMDHLTRLSPLENLLGPGCGGDQRSNGESVTHVNWARLLADA